MRIAHQTWGSAVNPARVKSCWLFGQPSTLKVEPCFSHGLPAVLASVRLKLTSPCLQPGVMANGVVKNLECSLASGCERILRKDITAHFHLPSCQAVRSLLYSRMRLAVVCVCACVCIYIYMYIQSAAQAAPKRRGRRRQTLTYISGVLQEQVRQT